MGIIKAFGGLNGYKDEECVRDVLNYAIGSKFFYELVQRAREIISVNSTL